MDPKEQTSTRPAHSQPSAMILIARAVAIGCSGTLILAFAAIAGYLWWANRPLPKLVDPPRALPRPNGFDACVRAAAKLPDWKSDSPVARPDSADPSALRRLLQPAEPALDEMRGAIRLPYVTPPVRDPDAPFPYLAKLRQAARGFASEARVARAQGNGRLAMDSALDAIELGSRVGRGGPLIHNLVGLACAAIGVSQAEQCVELLDADQVRAAGARLERIAAQFPTAADTMREERLLALSSARTIFQGNFSARGLIRERAGDGADDGTHHLGSTFYPKRWSYEQLDRNFQRLIGEISRPWPRRRPLPEPSDTLSAILLPVLDRGGYRFTLNEAELRLLRLELALREYLQRRGGYPAALAELGPAVGASMLTDPFSEHPFRYRRAGDGYLLYSVGPDGRDDGGTPVARKDLGNVQAHGDIVAGYLHPRSASR